MHFLKNGRSSSVGIALRLAVSLRRAWETAGGMIPRGVTNVGALIVDVGEWSSATYIRTDRVTPLIFGAFRTGKKQGIPNTLHYQREVIAL